MFYLSKSGHPKIQPWAVDDDLNELANTLERYLYSNNQINHDIGDKYSFLLYYRKSNQLKTVDNRGTRRRMQSHVPRVQESVQRLEDSENSEEVERNMDKLSDNENFKQFRGRSLHQTLESGDLQVSAKAISSTVYPRF